VREGPVIPARRRVQLDSQRRRWTGDIGRAATLGLSVPGMRLILSLRPATAAFARHRTTVPAHREEAIPCDKIARR